MDFNVYLDSMAGPSYILSSVVDKLGLKMKTRSTPLATGGFGNNKSMSTKTTRIKFENDCTITFNVVHTIGPKIDAVTNRILNYSRRLLNTQINSQHQYQDLPRILTC